MIDTVHLDEEEDTMPSDDRGYASALNRLLQQDADFLRAYTCMGEAGMSACTHEHGAVLYFDWEADAVRERLGITDAVSWFTLCIELEARRWLVWCSYSGWFPGYDMVSVDEVTADWGYAAITAPGIVYLLERGAR